MPNVVNNAEIFLISIIFDLYLFVLILRMIMQFVGVNFYNPIAQVIIKLTDPVVRPLQNIIPKYKKLDLATLCLLLVLQMIKITLIAWIQMDTAPNIGGLFVWSPGGLMAQVINIFFYSIFIMIILSWISPQGQNPIREILIHMTEPLIRPARKMMPNLGGMDLSPIPVMIGLKLLIILFANPLLQIGAGLALAS